MKIEIRSGVDSAELATLIVSTLEGGLRVSRLQRNDDALGFACRHLEEYLEAGVRARDQRPERTSHEYATHFGTTGLQGAGEVERRAGRAAGWISSERNR